MLVKIGEMFLRVFFKVQFHREIEAVEGKNQSVLFKNQYIVFLIF